MGDVNGWECIVCFENYASKADLTVHLRTHVGLKSIRCTLCSKLFINNSQLQEHMQTYHIEDDLIKSELDETKEDFDHVAKNEVKDELVVNNEEYEFDNLQIVSYDNLDYENDNIQIVRYDSVEDENDNILDVGYDNIMEDGTYYGEEYIQIIHDEAAENKFIEINQVVEGEDNFEEGEEFDGEAERIKVEIVDDDDDEAVGEFVYLDSDEDYSSMHCVVCCKAFNSQLELAEHLKKHIGLKPFDCPNCLESFPDKGSLITHVKDCSIQDNSLVKNSGDSKEFAKYKVFPDICIVAEEEEEKKIKEEEQAKLDAVLGKDALQAVKKRSRKTRLKCPNCPLTFDNICHLKIHFRKYTGEKPYKCPVCLRAFARNSNLNSHIRTHTGEKRFKCPYCPRKVDHKSALKVHIRVHTGEKPYKCSICGERFVHKRSRDSHVMAHNNERPFQCKICSKTFIKKYNLQIHMRIHYNIKPHECNLCWKAFTTKSSLSLHMDSHAVSKDFHCQICQKSFASKIRLKDHLKIHSGVRPFQCEFCAKTYYNKGHLKEHQKMHNGVKPYQCDICFKEFARKQDLNIHMDVHAGIKYACDLCSKTFSRKSRLYKHMRESHPDDPFE